MNKSKFWISTPRLIIISVVMLLIWGSLLWFWMDKADEISKHPCTICAQRQNIAVMCTQGGLIPISRTYYPNGTIEDSQLQFTIQDGG